MDIKLLPPRAKQIAQDILRKKRPPETYDLEVLQWLYTLDSFLTAYRVENKGTHSRKIKFNHEQIKIILERGIEVRPNPTKKLKLLA